MSNHTLYAYLNINHPMVAWEVAIGRVRSACDLGLDHQNFGISLWQYNLLHGYSKGGASARFLNELKLERTRQLDFSKSVSRLRGVYFFERERDAHAAIERWGIPGKREFISPVNFSATRITKVDSEWITAYLSSETSDWMESYWRGVTLGCAPLVELLVSGIGVVQSMELRRQAYQHIVNKFPDSTPLLAMACCGFKHGPLESIAQVVSGLIRNDDRILGDFYVYAGDLGNRQEELVKAMKACEQNGEMPPMILPSDPETFFSLPDLSSGSFSFSGPAIVSTYDEIHESIRN